MPTVAACEPEMKVSTDPFAPHWEQLSLLMRSSRSAVSGSLCTNSCTSPQWLHVICSACSDAVASEFLIALLPCEVSRRRLRAAFYLVLTSESVQTPVVAVGYADELHLLTFSAINKNAGVGL